MKNTRQKGTIHHGTQATPRIIVRSAKSHSPAARRQEQTARRSRLKNLARPRRKIVGATSTVAYFRRADLQDPAMMASRVKFAIRKARELQATLKAGDEDALAQTMLLQGILSGDVMAASFRVRQRLQQENLRLRRRLNMARIKTEQV